MTSLLNRHVARLAALGAAIVLVASCDSALPTGPTNSALDDVNRPTVAFSLSAGVNNTVDIGTPLSVTVTGTDDFGVGYMFTRISNGAQVLGIDTVTISPTQKTVARAVPVDLGDLSNGDKLTIRATVADGAGNEKTDSLIVTVADTGGPSLTVSSVKAARPVAGGDTIDISVSASDSSGIAYAGYRLLQLRATDSVTIAAESTFVTAGTRVNVFQPPNYSFAIPDTLLTGSYALVGFARDLSGVLTRIGKPGVAVTVTDGQAPTLTFLAPTAGAKLNVGDSLLVTAHLTDNIALKRVAFTGATVRYGAFGAAQTFTRYPTVADPATSYRPGLRDTLIQAMLRVQSPVDTVTDTLYVTGILTDLANNADTVRVPVKMVNGPSVTFLSPTLGDSAVRGADLMVSLRATSTLGVRTLGFRIQSAAGWPTPVDSTVQVNYGSALQTATMQGAIPIPADAPLKGVLTITPISKDVAGQDGSSAPLMVAVLAGTTPAPKVFQSIGTRIETKDTLYVTATGSSIGIVGYEASFAEPGDTSLIRRDSMTVSSSTIFPYAIPLNFSPTVQGKRVRVRSFAYDGGGRLGYSVRSTAVAQAVLVPDVDTALVVYGRTYALPMSRNGTIADLVVDRNRGNVFLSNKNFGRLEVWQSTNGQFDANGVVVGSQPWGMTLSRTAPSGDTLYVANSGGTNLSRVYIGAASPGNMKEDLANRLLTRVSFLYKLTEIRDPATGKIRITVSAPITYSDRPQFVEQSSSGRLYFSTKPTTAAPLGTVRYLDPAAPAPDERFILAFATPGSDPNSWLVANLDGATVTPASASSLNNDALTLCDHASGTTATATCATTTNGIQATIDALLAAVPTSDVEAGVNLDEGSLGLSDTTFAAASGNGEWITFGEGNTTRAFGRDFLLRDDGSVSGKYTYASPAINVADLINNAADKIYGVALDKTGKTLGIHGKESYFAAVSEPFTQRLQGKKSTFATGAGITFHPNADGTTTPASDRLAFVASANGSVEMVDIAYYDFSRGSLATKYNLYGPLRASLPFPGDDPSVVFKLFGLSSTGLVVIDVTANDIIAGP
ncbi:MAG TPA: hypothetical protein VL328_10225 [Gemmatimonadaceae bacterium]|jgi:hypothetical protein|nr:hypothetical protein [Gemmatimonadaceae bacterium]